MDRSNRLLLTTSIVFAASTLGACTWFLPPVALTSLVNRSDYPVRASVALVGGVPEDAIDIAPHAVAVLTKYDERDDSLEDLARRVPRVQFSNERCTVTREGRAIADLAERDSPPRRGWLLVFTGELCDR